MIMTATEPEVIDKIHAHLMWVQEEFSKQVMHEHKG